MENNNKVRFARFGIATKGFVYCLIGGLTALSALGLGGDQSGSSDALHFLARQTYGQILLGLTTLGIVGYVFWRFYQTFVDPEDKGNDAKGLSRRFGYFSSGFFYSLLAFSAIKILIGASSSGGGQESFVSTLLSKTYGQVLVAILATIFLGKAIYQLYRAYSGAYQKKVKDEGLDPRVQKIVFTFGKIGYTSRAVVIGIVSFLTYRAAFTSNSSEAGGTKDAFQFMQNEFGTIILAVIAFGLFAYGVFMIVKAIYREMSIS